MADGESRVTALFRARLAQRRGEMTDMDPELSAYGESLGFAPVTMPKAPAAGAAPVTMPAERPMTRPADMPRMPSTPASPAPMQREPDTGQPPRTRIPVLDALSDMPRVRSRGLRHDRKLGRVIQGDL